MSRGATREQLMAALRRADAAGDEAAARAIARRLKSQPKQEKGFWDQLGDAAKNVASGAVFEGLGAIPDAVTEAAAGGMRVINNRGADAASALYNMVGAPQLVDRVQQNRETMDRGLANPMTFRRMGEAVSPPPQDAAGQVARLGGALVGGAAYPQKLLPRAVQPVKAPSRLPKPDNPIVAAGQRQKIPVRRPDIDATARNKLATAEASRYGNRIVRNTLDDDAQALQSRVAEIGGRGAPETEAYNMGARIQDAGKGYIERTGKIFAKAYDDVERMSGGVRIQPKKAIAAIDDEIADLTASGANTNRAQIQFLQGLKDDMAKPGGFSVAEFGNLRSASKGVIRGDQGLTASDATRRLNNVVKSFSDDAREQLPKAASELLDETDKAYAQRQKFIGEVLQKHILGRRNNPLSAEQAAKNMGALTQGRANSDVVSKVWNVLPEDTQADFAATTASKLGKNRAGDFQTGRLASDIENFPRNIRETMFGQEGASSLDDLQILAKARRDTLGQLNHSRSSIPIVNSVLGAAAPASGGAAAGAMLTGNPIGAMAGAAAAELGRYGVQTIGAQRVLAPMRQAAPAALDDVAGGMSRWLANPAAANEASGLLSEPMLMRLAAQQREEEERKKRQTLGMLP